MHVIIEIAISMVGLYIIFSIVNSVLVEAYAQYVNKRGNHLKDSLDNFFQDPENESINLANNLYEHKLIQAFMEKGNVKPAWIDPKIFTQAFMELVFKNTHTKDGEFNGEKKDDPNIKLPAGLEKTLQFIINKATDGKGVDMGKVQTEIEGLYESYMVRVSEWYKKKMKFLLAITGVVLAFTLNLDSINFFTALKNDGQLRREQVQFSKNLNNNRDVIIAKIETMKDSLTVSGLNPQEVERGLSEITKQLFEENDARALEDNFSELKIGIHQFHKGKTSTGDYIWGIFGVLLTGFALSFGSTFWFGLLKKLVGK